MQIIMDFIGFMSERKKFWLMPIMIILLLFGVLVFFFAESVVAPFIYTIF